MEVEELASVPFEIVGSQQSRPLSMGPGDGNISKEPMYDEVTNGRVDDDDEDDIERQMALMHDTPTPSTTKLKQMNDVPEERTVAHQLFNAIPSLEFRNNDNISETNTQPTTVDHEVSSVQRAEIHAHVREQCEILQELDSNPGSSTSETTSVEDSMNHSQNGSETEEGSTETDSPNCTSNSDMSIADSDNDPPPILNKEEEMELAEAELEKETIRRAKEGNPAFVYPKTYSAGTTIELPTFRCFKCPTAVQKMEHLEYHYKFHGSDAKFKCAKCDFAHNIQSILLRHQERHIPPKPEVPAASALASINNGSMAKAEEKNDRDTGTQVSENKTDSLAQPHTSPKFQTPATVESQPDSTTELQNPANIGVVKCEEENETESESETANDDEDVLESKSSIVVLPNDSVKESRPVAKVRPMNHPKKKKKKKRNVFWFSRRGRVNKPKAARWTVSVPDTDTDPAGVSNNKPKTFARRNFGAAKNIPDEEYARLRAGNPKLYYPDRYGMSSGKRIAMSTFKCFKCPSPYISYVDYLRHAGCHGANLTFKCQVCDYSSSDRPHLTQHFAHHRLQGNIPEYLLTTSDEDAARPSSSRKLFNGGDDIMLLGNEDEFEIEYGMDDDDVLSDSEILDFAPAQKRLKTEDNRSSMPISGNKINQRAVVVLKKLDPSSIRRTAPPQPQIRTFQDAELYSLKYEKEVAFNPDNYLLTEIKLKNFMPFAEMNTALNFDAIQFVSNHADGKSSSIIAVLVAIGYDVLVEGSNPTTFCGWQLRDLIKMGEDTAELEIVLSLKRYPSLQDKYGSHLRLQRKLIRGLPLSSCNFQISSADMSGHHYVPPKPVGMSYLRTILKDLGIMPQLYRILLLDRENMKYMIKYTESWYGFFEEAKNSKTKFIQTKLAQLQFKMSRLEEDIVWRSAKVEFLKSQLECEYPVENPIFEACRKKDIELHIEAETELAEFEAKRSELESTISAYTRDIADISSTLLQQMNKTFNTFFQSQNFYGSILLDEDEKSMGIWIRENSSTSHEPPTVSEALNAWPGTNLGKRTTAIFGLYLSFWSIVESCPVFAIDSFSSSDLEFRYPSTGLKILLDLIQERRGQQFLLSLPETDGNGSSGNLFGM